jgi:hypothetical protein
VEPYYSSVVTLGPMDGGGAAPPDAAATFPGVVVRGGEISKLPRLAPPPSHLLMCPFDFLDKLIHAYIFLLTPTAGGGPAPLLNTARTFKASIDCFFYLLFGAGVENCYVFKSRLQEYVQKAGLPTPEYHTLKEGPSHEPIFKSTVLINNSKYESLPGFFSRKAAEQSAAEVALMEIARSVPPTEGFRAVVSSIHGDCQFHTTN